MEYHIFTLFSDHTHVLQKCPTALFRLSGVPQVKEMGEPGVDTRGVVLQIPTM